MINNDIHLARYVTIAANIAEKIVRGEYQEGQKVFGRSTLAGKYNVSPETIRRALSLLQEVGIVEVSPGVGVVVQSLEAAQKYLADFDQRRLLHDIHENLMYLMKERDKINQEINKLTVELMNHTLHLEARLSRIEEWKVLPESKLVGQPVVSKLSGYKIMAIRRGQEEIINPDEDSIIQNGDILIIYGPLDDDSKEGLLRV